MNKCKVYVDLEEYDICKSGLVDYKLASAEDFLPLSSIRFKLPVRGDYILALPHEHIESVDCRLSYYEDRYLKENRYYTVEDSTDSEGDIHVEKMDDYEHIRWFKLIPDILNIEYGTEEYTAMPYPTIEYLKSLLETTHVSEATLTSEPVMLTVKTAEETTYKDVLDYLLLTV